MMIASWMIIALGYYHPLHQECPEAQIIPVKDERIYIAQARFKDRIVYARQKNLVCHGKSIVDNFYFFGQNSYFFSHFYSNSLKNHYENHNLATSTEKCAQQYAYLILFLMPIKLKTQKCFFHVKNMLYYGWRIIHICENLDNTVFAK